MHAGNLVSHTTLFYKTIVHTMSVLRLAPCRYNISCYSSLLQQVDATADAELVFQQQAASAAAAQAARGLYGAVWLHPDDLQHLQQMQSQGPSVGGSVASGQGARAGVPGVGAARYALSKAACYCEVHEQQS